MLNLGNLKKAKGSTKEKRRVGRGKGSGMGNQATKGHDGQKGRSGKAHPYVGFEGGQMRLVRILPKRGFTPPHRVEFSVVNIADLDKAFEANSNVTLEMMVEKGLLKNLNKPVKVLARGDINKALIVQAHQFSNSAKDKIEKAGGKTEVI
ncbi:MAG: 50S ribosomal protein L15 [Candidatus Rifleibacteriota bacterium]